MASTTVAAIDQLAGMWDAFDAAQRVVIPEQARTVADFGALWGMSRAGAQSKLDKLVADGKLSTARRGCKGYYWPVQV